MEHYPLDKWLREKSFQIAKRSVRVMIPHTCKNGTHKGTRLATAYRNFRATIRFQAITPLPYFRNGMAQFFYVASGAALSEQSSIFKILQILEAPHVPILISVLIDCDFSSFFQKLWCGKIWKPWKAKNLTNSSDNPEVSEGYCWIKNINYTLTQIYNILTFSKTGYLPNEGWWKRKRPRSEPPRSQSFHVCWKIVLLRSVCCRFHLRVRNLVPLELEVATM